MSFNINMALLRNHRAVSQEKLENWGITLHLNVNYFISAILYVFNMTVEVSHLSQDYFTIRNKGLYQVFFIVNDLDFDLLPFFLRREFSFSLSIRRLEAIFFGLLMSIPILNRFVRAYLFRWFRHIMVSQFRYIFESLCLILGLLFIGKFCRVHVCELWGIHSCADGFKQTTVWTNLWHLATVWDLLQRVDLRKISNSWWTFFWSVFLEILYVKLLLTYQALI